MSKLKLLLLISLVVGVGVAAYLWSAREKMSARESPELRPSIVQAKPSEILNSSKTVLVGSASAVQAMIVHARSGDRYSACKLASSLSACLNRAKLQKSNGFITGALAPFGSEVADDQIEVLASMHEESDKLSGLCESISPEIMRSAYDYQVLAADGKNAELDRWILFNPLLDNQNFLDDLDRWKDYRARSDRYISDLMQRRSLDSLPVVLDVYAPEQIANFRPPYHVDDPSTFLALYRVALEHGVSLPDELVAAAKMLQRTATPEENREAELRYQKFGTNWSGDPPGKSSFSTSRYFSMESTAGRCV